ncbi:MAG: hypothetical protein AAF657_20735 [Acidobacteriota bacterium]
MRRYRAAAHGDALELESGAGPQIEDPVQATAIDDGGTRAGTQDPETGEIGDVQVTGGSTLLVFATDRQGINADRQLDDVETDTELGSRLSRVFASARLAPNRRRAAFRSTELST